MKKLCKLFWKNDTLGKWILYDSETKLILEVKKFKEDGADTHLNPLEQGMLEKGVLELDHSVKIWEVELQLAEFPVWPAIPDLLRPAHPPFNPNPAPWFNQLVQNPPQQQWTSDRTSPPIHTQLGGGAGGVGMGSATFTFGSSAEGNGWTISATNSTSQNQMTAASNSQNIVVTYRREDEEFDEDIKQDKS